MYVTKQNVLYLLIVYRAGDSFSISKYSAVSVTEQFGKFVRGL